MSDSTQQPAVNYLHHAARKATEVGQQLDHFHRQEFKELAKKVFCSLVSSKQQCAATLAEQSLSYTGQFMLALEKHNLQAAEGIAADMGISLDEALAKLGVSKSRAGA